MSIQANQIQSGNLGRTFFRYVSLNVLSMLGLSLYILADTFFIANGVGNDGLVALNIVIPFFNLISGIGMLLGIGGATCFSVALGSRDTPRATRAFSQALSLAVVLGALFTLLGLLYPEPIVRLLGATGEVLDLSIIYLRTIACFSFLFMFNNLMVAFVRNDGNPNLAMAAMITASLSNILLDYIFVFPMGMGMFGAALATGFAPIISTCVLSAHFIRRKNHFRFTPPTFIKAELARILHAGFPSLITELSTGIVILLFNRTLFSLAGNHAVAAYGIITNIAMVCIAIFNGVSQGAQPLISFLYGAEKPKPLRRVFRYLLGTVIIFGILFFLCGLFLTNPMIAAFNRDQSAELAAFATDGIHIYFSAFLIMGINLGSISLFAATLHPRQAYLLSFLRGILLVIPLLFLFARIAGIHGVWATVPCTEAFTLMLTSYCLIRYFQKSLS